jgi:SAM-dependent methyltransferase
VERQRGLTDSLYVRHRLAPRRGDVLYVACSDLLLAVKRLATNAPIRILDYGADLAPYRALFPNSEYRCADLAARPGVDYVVRQDGTLGVPSEAFDLVLSTQVVEHVARPPTYFGECFRLLKPGGMAFVSTHGSFEDHGFPEDYQRWTASGLRRDLLAVGFEEVEILKVTSGPRAAFFLVERCLETTFLPRRTAAGLTLWALRCMTRWARRWSHWLLDVWYGGSRLMSETDPNARLYVCLAAYARRGPVREAPEALFQGAVR